MPAPRPRGLPLSGDPARDVPGEGDAHLLGGADPWGGGEVSIPPPAPWGGVVGSELPGDVDGVCASTLPTGEPCVRLQRVGDEAGGGAPTVRRVLAGLHCRSCTGCTGCLLGVFAEARGRKTSFDTCSPRLWAGLRGRDAPRFGATRPPSRGSGLRSVVLGVRNLGAGAPEVAGAISRSSGGVFRDTRNEHLETTGTGCSSLTTSTHSSAAYGADLRRARLGGPRSMDTDSPFDRDRGTAEVRDVS